MKESDAAGTAILAATAGKWARLVSGRINWVNEMSNMHPLDRYVAQSPDLYGGR